MLIILIWNVLQICILYHTVLLMINVRRVSQKKQKCPTIPEHPSSTLILVGFASLNHESFIECCGQSFILLSLFLWQVHCLHVLLRVSISVSPFWSFCNCRIHGYTGNSYDQWINILHMHLSTYDYPSSCLDFWSRLDVLDTTG